MHWTRASVGSKLLACVSLLPVTQAVGNCKFVVCVNDIYSEDDNENFANIVSLFLGSFGWLGHLATVVHSISTFA